MKNAVFASLMLASAMTAASTFGTLEYTYYDGYGKNQDEASNAYTFQAGTEILDSGVVVDLSTEFENVVDSNQMINSLEAGASYEVPFAWNFSGYGRVGLGQRWFDTGDFTYYSVEPGVKFAATDQVGLSAGYRFRDGFETQDEYRTGTMRLAGNYEFLPGHSAMIGYDRSFDQIEYGALRIAYTHSF